TLWEIAKRYAVPQEDIVSFNNLEDAAMLPIGSRLLIPGI
ncbi:MAG: LysM peptidoglycan-binding domain-containing protein, partial [Clostridia bacterium]|nr:LysM peptidoglycan-binding domain-containing protein [Clostridia bacterium]